jgi:hypothetical protein
VLDEARRLCAFLTQRVGPDPLCLRWPLAVRAVGRAPDWVCLSCERGAESVAGCVFYSDKEFLRSPLQLQRLASWFGADLFSLQ